MTRIIAVAGAGAPATNISSTTAANLTVALASLGFAVELLDLDPAAHATRALTGGTPEPPAADGVRRVTLAGAELTSGRRAGATPRILRDAALDRDAVPLRVVECPLRLDAAGERALRGADLVVVPIDASTLARRALAEVALLVDRGPMPDAPRAAAAADDTAGADRGSRRPRLRVVLSRLLPRTVDRWALVDAIGERHPEVLYGATLPMGRAAATSGVAGGVPATLYSPAGRAAAAYRVAARLVLRDLGVAVPNAGAEIAR